MLTAAQEGIEGPTPPTEAHRYVSCSPIMGQGVFASFFDLQHYTAMDLSFLTNREWALYTWLLGVVIWVVCEPDMRKNSSHLIKALFQPILVKLYLATITWTALSVWLLATLGIWQVQNLKTTVLWFFTYAFISLNQATTHRRRPDYYCKLLLGTVNISILLAFLADSYSFSLISEFVLVPLSFFIFALDAVAGMRQFEGEEYALTRKVVSWGPPLFGFFLLGHAISAAINHGDFVSVANLRDMAMPSFLSVLFFPFLHVFCLVLAYENLQFGLPDKKLRRYGVWKSLWAFRFRQSYVDAWRRELNLQPPSTRELVDESISRTLVNG